MATTLRREVPSDEALASLNANGDRSRYPRRFRERRTRHPFPPLLARSVYPVVRPSFALRPGSRVFTIGSCFAREVETHLDAYDLPTPRLALPKDEWPGRANGALNVYTPGAIARRIERAFAAAEASPETIVRHGKKEAKSTCCCSGCSRRRRSSACSRGGARSTRSTSSCRTPTR